MKNRTEETTEPLLMAAVRQGMEHSVSHLDWQTQAKLTHLRLQALERANHSSVSFGFSSLSRGFAVAAAVTLAATLWVLPDQVVVHPSAEVFTADVDINAMDVLMSGEDMDLLENLDMYEWLDAEYG